MRVATMYVVALFLLSALLALPQMCAGAYVDGVYWLKGGVAHVSGSVHNDQPGDQYPLVNVYFLPGGFEAWAPPGFHVRYIYLSDVLWEANDLASGIQPGSALSGFNVTVPYFEGVRYDFYYKLIGPGGEPMFGGWFTPHLIPEPGFAALAVAVCLGAPALRRRRR